MFSKVNILKSLGKLYLFTLIMTSIYVTPRILPKIIFQSGAFVTLVGLVVGFIVVAIMCLIVIVMAPRDFVLRYFPKLSENID